MRWRGASSPDMPRLVGTYMHEGHYRTVTVTEPRSGRFLVCEERLGCPGFPGVPAMVAQFDRPVRAVREAEMRVLAHGGLLMQEAEGIANAAVSADVAEALFCCDERFSRFLHVPARPLAG